MSFARQTLMILAKDLRIELRSREIVVAMVFFASLVVIILAFSFLWGQDISPDLGCGALWIALALSGTLGLNRAFDREREGDTFRALLLAPVPRPAIYLGKMAGVTLFMLIAELVSLLLIVLFFRTPVWDRILPLALILLLGTIGYAAIGSLFAAMLMRARARDILLAVILYPVILPLLAAGVRATAELLATPADMKVVWAWTRGLFVYDALFLTAALWIFEPLVVE